MVLRIRLYSLPRSVFNCILFLLPLANIILMLDVLRGLNASSFLVLAELTIEDDVMLQPDEFGNCPVGHFNCNNTIQCVPQRCNCDGTADCGDASDEWNCVNDVDAKYWDHLFRKQPYGRLDHIPVGSCFWPNSNLSCPCRGNEILCSFQQLSSIPTYLPAHDIVTLDLTGNNFTLIDEAFFVNLPKIEILILKFCSIAKIESNTFQRLSEIPLQTLYLDENKIKELPEHLFPLGNNLSTLILSGNEISTLHSYDFEHLSHLEELDLRRNRIENFEARVFEPLINLEVLYLNENKIRSIRAGMFPTLNKLHTLSLANNLIEKLEPHSFPFPRLLNLFLASNRLTAIEARTFCRLELLEGLHLNHNALQHFDLEAFACLESLTSLLLTDNDFKTLDTRVLHNLTHLTYVYFSWFHLCRAALHVRVCEPHGDGISSTHHLLDNTLLRGSVWIMASVAIVGNLLVLLGRYFYKSRSNVEHSLYLRNLAVSDFLMGIYLAIIACADINFRGHYILHEQQWRQSAICSFAGFLSTLSCQLSTLLLTLVTWDRLKSVTRPLQPRDNTRTRIAIRMCMLWGVSFALASAPLIPSAYFGRHFYGNNGVCLSLHIHDPYAKGWEYSAMLFMVTNTLALVFILVSHVRMLEAIRDSGGVMRSTLSGRESVVATRFIVIVTTDCACWLPIIAVKAAALSGIVIPSSLYAWLAVFILPLNAALNPVLYTLTTAAFKQQIRNYCPAIPSCSQNYNNNNNNNNNNNTTTTGGEQRSQTQTENSLTMSQFGAHNSSCRKKMTQRQQTFV